MNSYAKAITNIIISESVTQFLAYFNFCASSLRSAACFVKAKVRWCFGSAKTNVKKPNANFADIINCSFEITDCSSFHDNKDCCFANKEQSMIPK